MKNDTKISGVQNPGVAGVFPASSAQTFFWYQEQSSPCPGSENIAVRWEIRGTFKDESIEKAAQYVVNRHEVLRTRFVENDGLLYQEILETADFQMGVIDVRDVPDHQRGPRIDEIASS